MEAKRRKLNFAHADGTAKLLHILPKEVWLQIWTNINQTSYYYQICATSNLLRNLGLTQRTRILIDRVAGMLPNYIPEEQFLKIRGVCHSWKQAVDKCFQQNWENCEQIRFASYDRIDRTTWQNGAFVEGLFEKNKLQQFLDHFEQTHDNANPFIDGRLTITIHSGRTDFPESMQLLTELLEKYGAHVWKCAIRMSCARGAGVICMDVLNQVLQKLTSLKHLHLKSVWLRSLDDQEIERQLITTVRSLQKITETDTPAPLLLSLLKSNSQLKMLDSATFCRNAKIWEQELEMGLLRNLQKLTITTIESSSVFNPRVFPQLRSLHLNTDDDSDDEDEDDDKELEVMFQLAGVVEEVYFEISEEYMGGLMENPSSASNFWFQFPKLKQVHFRRQDKRGWRSFFRKTT